MARTSAPFRVDDKSFKKMVTDAAKFGLCERKGPGLHRIALSPEDFKGREWVVQQMLNHGLEVHIDGALNIHGVLRKKGDCSKLKPSKDFPRVVTGSHFDTVIGGGHLDGALGVIAGIHALGCIKNLVEKNEIKLETSLEVIDFTDEEGRCRQQISKDWHLLASATSSCEEDAARAASASAYPTGSVKYYVELHIEQGPVLDASNEKLAVVSGICGLWKSEFTLKGQANHAGTTPMHARRNAFEGCASVQTAIPELLRSHGGAHTVCTIGSVRVLPGSPNVVPGECIFTVEVRDADRNVIDCVAAAVSDKVGSVARMLGLVVAEVRLMSEMPPTLAATPLVSLLAGCCQAVTGVQPRKMPSGAAHDAQQMASLAPMGMVFVPSIGGISHDAKENTRTSDLVLGANVLLNALIKLAVQPATCTSGAQFEAASLKTGDLAASSSPISRPGGPNCALLCIDLQDMPPTSLRSDIDFTPEQVASYNRNLPGLLMRVAAAQSRAREIGLEVIHCRIESHTQDGRDRSALHKRMRIHVPPGSAQWLSGIEPMQGEVVINKTGSNVFACTNIDYLLRNMGTRKLVCCGVLTEECVAGAVKSAADLGYECIVLKDACMSGCEVRHKAALQTLARYACICSAEEWISETSKQSKL